MVFCGLWPKTTQIKFRSHWFFRTLYHLSFIYAIYFSKPYLRFLLEIGKNSKPFYEVRKLPFDWTWQSFLMNCWRCNMTYINENPTQFPMWIPYFIHNISYLHEMTWAIKIPQVPPYKIQRLLYHYLLQSPQYNCECNRED